MFKEQALTPHTRNMETTHRRKASRNEFIFSDSSPNPFAGRCPGAYRTLRTSRQGSTVQVGDRPASPRPDSRSYGVAPERPRPVGQEAGVARPERRLHPAGRLRAAQGRSGGGPGLRQEEAGTAVCIADEGLLLTCSHCCADEAGNRPGKSKLHWLIFSSGRVVGAKCIAWDAKRDLALLRITKAQRHSYKGVSQLADYQFPSVKVATEHIAVGSRMMCIGHPGSEDLEAEEAGIETGYDVLHASAGRFRGHAEGQDVQDNSEIGALMHDCWTYWGHSGAPLLAWATGQLVGLHSSWDDQTAMRRGVALEATREFLKEHGFAHLI
ncbi:AT hook domain-containing protein [Apiospora arundinis]